MKKIILFFSLIIMMGLIVSCDNVSKTNSGEQGILITTENNVKTIEVGKTLQQVLKLNY